jgi:hypothetical protein
MTSIENNIYICSSNSPLLDTINTGMQRTSAHPVPPPTKGLYMDLMGGGGGGAAEERAKFSPKVGPKPGV